MKKRIKKIRFLLIISLILGLLFVPFRIYAITVVPNDEFDDEITYGDDDGEGMDFSDGTIEDVNKIKENAIKNGTLRCPKNSSDKCKEFDDDNDGYTDGVVITEKFSDTLEVEKEVKKTTTEGTFEVSFRAKGKTTNVTRTEAGDACVYAVIDGSTTIGSDYNDYILGSNGTLASFAGKLFTEFKNNEGNIFLATSTFYKEKSIKNKAVLTENGYISQINGFEQHKSGQKSGSPIWKSLEDARNVLSSNSNCSANWDHNYIVILSDGRLGDHRDRLDNGTSKCNTNPYDNSGNNGSCNGPDWHYMATNGANIYGILYGDYTKKVDYGGSHQTGEYIISKYLNGSGSISYVSEKSYAAAFNDIANQIISREQVTVSGNKFKITDKIGKYFKLVNGSGSQKKFDIETPSSGDYSPIESFKIKINASCSAISQDEISNDDDFWFNTNAGFKVSGGYQSGVNPQVYWKDCEPDIEILPDEFSCRENNTKEMILETDSNPENYYEHTCILKNTYDEKSIVKLLFNGSDPEIGKYDATNGIGITMKINGNIDCSYDIDVAKKDADIKKITDEMKKVQKAIDDNKSYYDYWNSYTPPQIYSTYSCNCRYIDKIGEDGNPTGETELVCEECTYSEDDPSYPSRADAAGFAMSYRSAWEAAQAEWNDNYDRWMSEMKAINENFNKGKNALISYRAKDQRYQNILKNSSFSNSSEDENFPQVKVEYGNKDKKSFNLKGMTPSESSYNCSMSDGWDGSTDGTCTFEVSKSMYTPESCLEVQTGKQNGTPGNCYGSEKDSLSGGKNFYPNMEDGSGTIKITLVNFFGKNDIEIGPSSTGACTYTTGVAPTIYREVNVSDPFNLGLDPNRGVGDNWSGKSNVGNLDFSKVIDSKTWSQEPRYVVKLSKQDIDNINSDTNSLSNSVSKYTGDGCTLSTLDSDKVYCSYIHDSNTATNISD